MSRNIVLLITALLLAGCEAPPTQIQTFDAFGAESIFSPSNDQKVFAVATWCPYSRKFISALKHPEISPYIDDELIFIVTDEMKMIREAGQEQGLDGQELTSFVSRFKDASGAFPVVIAFPEYMSEFPGEVLITKTPDNFTALEGYPGYLINGNFSEHALTYLEEEVPLELLMRVYEEIE